MWLIEHAAHYGEPAFVEYGPFQSDIRNGIWKTYSDQGVLQASETYRNGLKDGEGRYFEDGHLICLGHYLGLNAKKLYDTVMVEDAHTNQLKPVRIKTDVGSVRHGLWVYYDIRTGRMKRSEEYQGDELVSEHDYTTLTARDSLYIDQKMQQLPHRSRQEQADIIPVPSSKQKRIRYTEFPDDIPYVTPNVRKK